MKTILFFFISVIVLLQGCTIENENFNTEVSDKLNFPIHIEKFGKAVAEEIHQTVINLNAKGVDYSNANDSPEFKEQFFKDWIEANPSIRNTEVTIDQMFGDSGEFIEGFHNLTNIQIEFINRLSRECAETTSYDNFCDRLICINNDIYAQVPEIEQERLFYITAVLYYAISEIQSIERQGQMLITPQTRLKMARVKTKGESGDFWGTCRTIYQSVCTLTIGEKLIETGEIVVSISRAMVAGVAMFAAVLCVSDTDPHTKCITRYNDCMNNNSAWSSRNSGGWGYTMCQRCYDYCVAQGVWDCPRPI